MVVGVVSKYVHTPNSRNEEVCQWLTVKANDTNLLSNCPRSSFIYNALHTLQFKEFREFIKLGRGNDASKSTFRFRVLN